MKAGLAEVSAAEIAEGSVLDWCRIVWLGGERGARATVLLGVPDHRACLGRIQSGAPVHVAVEAMWSFRVMLSLGDETDLKQR